MNKKSTIIFSKHIIQLSYFSDVVKVTDAVQYQIDVVNLNGKSSTIKLTEEELYEVYKILKEKYDNKTI